MWTLTEQRSILFPLPARKPDDALLIHLPEEGIIFGGDFVMPYPGAPFAEEGTVEGFIDGITAAEDLKPKQTYAHDGINFLFPTTETLLGYLAPIAWLGGTRQKLYGQRG